MSDDHESEVVLFTSLTGADATTARSYLEAMDWQVQEAFEMYNAVEGGQARGTPEEDPRDPGILPSHTGNQFPMGTFDDDMDEATRQAILAAQDGDSPGRGSQSRSRGGSGASVGGGDDMGEDGVRAPINSFHDTLIQSPTSFMSNVPIGGMGGMGGVHVGGMPGMGMPPMGMTGPMGAIGGNGDIPDSEWMFPPPKNLSVGGDIQTARQRARDTKRWLLVNIQNLDIFDSHRLNRDTWSSDTIQTLIDSAFVFWQRSSSCAAGQNYMRLYNASGDDLPHIAIIGPTGAKMWSYTGFIAPDELSMQLVEFLDLHSFEDTSAPRVRHNSRSKTDIDAEAAPHYQVSDVMGSQSSAASGVGPNGRDDQGDRASAEASSASSTVASSGIEELMKLSVKELRSLAETSGVDISGILEKGEIVTTLDAAGVNIAPLPPPPAERVDDDAAAAAEAAAVAADNEDEELARALALSMAEAEQGQPGGERGAEDPDEDDGQLPSPGSTQDGEARSGDQRTSTAGQGPREGVAPEVNAAEGGPEPEPAAHIPEECLSGPSPEEPAQGAPDSTRLQLRLAEGKPLVRRFLVSDTVADIFKVVLEQIPEGRERPFSLQTAFPSVDLRPLAHQTLEEAQLRNTSIAMRWT